MAAKKKVARKRLSVYDEFPPCHSFWWGRGRDVREILPRKRPARRKGERCGSTGRKRERRPIPTRHHRR